MYRRLLSPLLQTSLRKPYGLLLLGPRQVGKTTILKSALENQSPWVVSLQVFETLQDHLKDASLFRRQALARLESLKKNQKLVVFIDEVQKLPRLLDDCQSLYDEHKGSFQFVVTGSSARKLRKDGANLLPGRLFFHHLHPLTWQEMGFGSNRNSVFTFKGGFDADSPSSVDWKEGLIHGSLPGVSSADEDDRAHLLQSYTHAYLQEEIQAEALVRSLEGFSRFLELSARESGNTTNYQKLAQEIGLKLNTVKNYYQILVDTLVSVKLDPYLTNARKRMISTPKLYYFDIGVRNAAAGFPLTKELLALEEGRLFEHWVVLELIRRFNYLAPHYRCYFWRTSSGAEVDLIVDTGKELIPIEIKASRSTRNVKLKGIHHFMKDYGCGKGYVVGQFPESEKLEKNVTALPWQLL